MINQDILTEVSQIGEHLEKLRALLGSPCASPVTPLHPVGWSSRSVASYYQPRYAEHLRKLPIKMKEDGVTSRQFSRKEFYVATKTLYSRLSLGYKYLCDHMDKAGEYKGRVSFSRAGS